MSWKNQLAGFKVAAKMGKTMKEPADRSPLPVLTPIEGLAVEEPLKLLDPQAREKLNQDLDEMARSRREAEATSHTLRLS